MGRKRAQEEIITRTNMAMVAAMVDREEGKAVTKVGVEILNKETNFQVKTKDVLYMQEVQGIERIDETRKMLDVTVDQMLE